MWRPGDFHTKIENVTDHKRGKGTVIVAASHQNQTDARGSGSSSSITYLNSGSILMFIFHLHTLYTWSPAFGFHIHDFPKITTLAVILRTSITCPPIFVYLTILFHVGSQNCRHAAFAPRYTVRFEIWSVETEGNVDPTVGGLDRCSRTGWIGWSIEIYCGLWRNGMLKSFLGRCMHDG